MILRTTADILSGHSENGFQDKHLKDILALKKDWDYSRELKIEDIDLWEVISEYGGGGAYAAWMPFAEFYLLIVKKEIVTFYGKGAQKELLKEALKHGITIPQFQVYVEPEDMWLYQ